ncbi:hypothetical protein [Rubritalea sp.]|uniref:hypothetical protein n=1 Tax=Rubritalea sp. TaxID=2109375 RepID=UPI003EF754DF
MNPLIKLVVRARFTLTTRKVAVKQMRRSLEVYQALAERIDKVEGGRSVLVPRMAGVDEDMRGWSFYQLLEHVVIVNRTISARIDSLMTGVENSALNGFDVKRDVMPPEDSDVFQVAALQESVMKHLRVLKTHTRLRSSPVTDHPLFGSFSAHMWNCMFAFHMQLHIKQAQAIIVELERAR